MTKRGKSMKRVGLTAVCCAIVIMFSSSVCCESRLQVNSQVPSKPYFMIGDIIYTVRLDSQNSLDGTYSLCYRYIGFSDRRIRIRAEYLADDDFNRPHVPSEDTTIVVTFDEEEKGYLLVPALPKRPDEIRVLPLELVIGLYDRQKGLITVDEYGKQHISQRRPTASYKKSTPRSSKQLPGSYGK